MTSDITPPEANPAADAAARALSRVVPGRACGTCTLCCKVIAVVDFEKPPGVVVSALRARQRLRHLRDAADRVPHLLLRVDAEKGLDAGMEARASEVRAGHGRGRAS